MTNTVPTTRSLRSACLSAAARQSPTQGVLHRLLRAATLLSITAALFATTPVCEAAAGINLFDQQRGVLTVAPVIEKAAPAVVNISTASRRPGADTPLFRDRFFQPFFALPDQVPDQQVMSAGSGVIVDARRGYVLTNHHVIDGAERITVKLKDGRRFTADLIGSDEATDIAVLRIEAEQLTALPLHEAEDLKVGDMVIAIGNPFGLGQTVTSGIISALDRSGISRDKYEDFIQTDAPINPGNSGGALINTRGELVGINTAIIAPGGGNVGIGFAVPVDMAKAVMEQLIRHGEVRRGRIGVSVQDVTPDIADALDLPVRHGALIGQVEAGSPADRAGLQSGDTVIALNGTPVRSSNDLRNSVGLKERGLRIRLTIVRGGRKQDVSVTIGRVPTARLRGGSSLPLRAGARNGRRAADADGPAHALRSPGATG